MRIVSILTFMVFMIGLSYRLLLPDPIVSEDGTQVTEKSFLNNTEKSEESLKQLNEIEEFAELKIAEQEKKEELEDMRIILDDLISLWEQKIFAPKYNISDLHSSQFKISSLKKELNIEGNALDGLKVELVFYLLIEERMSLDEIASLENPSLQKFLNMTNLEWEKLNDYIDSREFTKKIFTFKGMGEEELPPEILKGEKIGRSIAGSQVMNNDFGAKLNEKDEFEEGHGYEDNE
ncbi:MAG: hypothetical protein KC493_09080 [Bacteriovoracaceae bacterium]|nr:hypothetical protein [Bacteriovoracaceae bacterium]